MNGFVTTQRYARVLNLPLSLSQTELAKGKSIYISEIPLEINQRLEVRSLTLTVAAILTPGVIPAYLNTAMSLASVGVYRGKMITSPLTYAAFTEQATTTNPFSVCVIETPGTYNVIVSNNTSNTDLSVIVTGAVKLYY